jgi:hypothetical protein
MLPSLHDNYLVSYAVDCAARRIEIRARRPHSAGGESRIVVFDGVEAYHFQNDAFGNIIFSLELIGVEHLLSKYRSEIAESYRTAGAPGPWAADLDLASQILKDKGVQGFILSSSYGLSGWVLAKDAQAAPGEEEGAARWRWPVY